jgi:hypothetical protein
MATTQHWALTFTPEDRPWFLKRQDRERGMVDEPPPAALIDYIEKHFGQFDLFPAFEPQTVRVEWLHWPPA